MSLEDALNDIVRDADAKVTQDDQGRKVIKTITPTAEQRALVDQGLGFLKQSVDLVAKADSFRRKFFTDIEIETGFYMNQMRYDEDKGLIYVYESPIN